ncbi:hypothetical protein [Simplicispira psychrophila]|uniref:hypothetical protein n=1 Tax=Simplicispira psychrophila TaxID=80882 RepID=UPI0004836C45
MIHAFWYYIGERFSVVRGFCGQGLRLQEGMVFPIEPRPKAGKRATRELPAGGTDRSEYPPH